MPPLLSVPEWDGDNFFTYCSQRESKMPLKMKIKRVTYFTCLLIKHRGDDARFHNGKCHDKKQELCTMHNPYFF
jgi:hypothetical protein